jgi:hypothetical protein
MWDDVSDSMAEAVFGFVAGATPDQDRYLFPTDEMLEEYSDHYFREWNPFCEKTFLHLKNELDAGRGRPMTRGEWKRYFQSSNRGSNRPRLSCSQAFTEEGLSRIKGAMAYQPWNKRRIGDIARDLPHQFLADF